MSCLIASSYLSSADLRELGLTEIPGRIGALRCHHLRRPDITRATVYCLVLRGYSWEGCLSVFLRGLKEHTRDYDRLYKRLEAVYDVVMRRRAVRC